MSKMSNGTSSNMGEEKVFDFFSLPREMRDAIYKELGFEIVLK